MAFRLDTAVNTLISALNELADAWPGLDAGTRQKLEPLIQQHGRDVVNAYSAVLANRMIAFLQALWDVQDLLPGAVVQTLQAGQGVSQRFLLSVDPEARETLRKTILRITDPRYYVHPNVTAGQISTLVAAHQDRLSDVERAAWQAADAAFQQDRDGTKYLKQVEPLLAHYPAVAQVLDDGKTWVLTLGASPLGVAPPGAQPPSAPPPSAPPPTAGAEAAAGAGTGDGTFNRYANIHFPSIVLLAQKAVPLVVHIAADYDPTSAVLESGAALALRAGDLTVVVLAEGFEVASGIGGQAVAGNLGARVVAAAPDCDCEPVVFFLNPLSAGDKQISVGIYQFGRHIASLPFSVSVVEQFTGRDLPNAEVAKVALSSPGPGAQPPDLELRVMLSKDGQTLTYMLHSPASSDYNFKMAGEKTLVRNPQDTLQRYIDRLSAMASTTAAGRPADVTAKALQDLRDIGSTLFDELFSDELKQEYAKIRERYAGKSFLITTEEPWIPWELLRPVLYDDDGTCIYDEDTFLCEKFQLAHWLAGRGTPDRLALRQGALIAPPDNLQAVKQEQDYFDNVRREQWAVDIQGPLTTVASVQQCMNQGDTQLLHFACHGNFDSDAPNSSRLKLADASLQPDQLVSARGGLAKSRPLVFLNACSAGRTGLALTGLGGWALQFWKGGASVFIGTQWAINDQLAAQFAIEFYNRLWGLGDFAGQPMALGQAFYQARLAVKQADPANSTWLAYVLYGDPQGSISLQQGA